MKKAFKLMYKQCLGGKGYYYIMKPGGEEVVKDGNGYTLQFDDKNKAEILIYELNKTWNYWERTKK